ncbi:unnamed protein product [Mycena citricolor]|uniref:Uncharacterized protein n=1 Tax=Mycena citricolor TaxID=2018698 RepID=A0AAD2K8D3_9AGAR|nr:unnamed protein product [Mycena citricolor]
MALTQSARHPGAPSWDDEVVPALRKRLEGESRMLSRRISAAVSISSIEDADIAYQARPSYSQTSSSGRSEAPRIAHSDVTTSTQRARTYSQPKLSEISTGRLSSSRDPKPTRIPKATRGREGSITTGGASNNTSPYSSPHVPSEGFSDSRGRDDALVIPAALANKASHDTIHIPHHQTSGLLNEPAPFGSGPSSAHSHGMEDAPRPSVDSEERPFEHWYRGDVSRNGGVGELKVGKRAEMLEIANYGHTLRQRQALAASREAELATPRRRKRSESAADMRPGSVYLDEDHANNVGRVLDEGPLTDLDTEMSDVDATMQYGLSVDHSAGDHSYRSVTPTQLRTPTKQTRKTRIPSPTPPAVQRGASEPPSVPASSSLSQAGRQIQSSSRATTTSPPPSAKKPRTTATPKPKPKPAKSVRSKTVDDSNRRSVAHYPSPGGDDEEDMADAIPSWTQPVKPATGRWDDVVLPVVARKKGLDGHYEQADGSPKPKTQDSAIAPAAGTFAWDHTKYRPPRDGDIPLDEFGRPLDPEAPDGDTLTDDAQYPPNEHERTPVGPKQTTLEPPRSPAPFSHYRDLPNTANMTAVAEPFSAPAQNEPKRPPEDEDGAGCCQCVVM